MTFAFFLFEILASELCPVDLISAKRTTILLEVHALACHWTNYKVIKTLTKEGSDQCINLRDVCDIGPGYMGHDVRVRQRPKTQ
jgi:hypothetical protein